MTDGTEYESLDDRLDAMPIDADSLTAEAKADFAFEQIRMMEEALGLN